jgi:hypothetical protein
MSKTKLHQDFDRNHDCVSCAEVFAYMHNLIEVRGVRSLTFAFHCLEGHGGTGCVDTHDDRGGE